MPTLPVIGLTFVFRWGWVLIQNWAQRQSGHPRGIPLERFPINVSKTQQRLPAPRQTRQPAQTFSLCPLHLKTSNTQLLLTSTPLEIKHLLYSSLTNSISPKDVAFIFSLSKRLIAHFIYIFSKPIFLNSSKVKYFVYISALYQQ